MFCRLQNNLPVHKQTLPMFAGGSPLQIKMQPVCLQVWNPCIKYRFAEKPHPNLERYSERSFATCVFQKTALKSQGRDQVLGKEGCVPGNHLNNQGRESHQVLAQDPGLNRELTLRTGIESPGCVYGGHLTALALPKTWTSPLRLAPQVSVPAMATRLDSSGRLTA